MNIQLYKLCGGVNWCPCRVIAKDRDLIWIENLKTGTRPLLKLKDVEFKDSGIESIENNIAYVCGDCGSVKFHILKSGISECEKCGALVSIADILSNK